MAMIGLIFQVLGGVEELYPEFTVNISNLDFGYVIVGNTKVKSITVQNTGTKDLEIDSIKISDQHFVIDPLSGIIAPNASQIFNITFAPSYSAQYNSIIEFSHNGGRNVVLATGIGIDVITIDDARKLPMGTEFATEGTVTRTLGQYTRIQDETGALTILQTNGLFYDAVLNSGIKMSDKIQIQGKLSEFDYLKVINGTDLTDFTRLSRENALPTPLLVTLDNIANNGEFYESKLISVVGLTVPVVGDNNFKESTSYQITDLSDNSNSVVIRIGLNENTKMSGMPFLEQNVTFTGVLSQSSLNSPTMGYQLTPILQTDLLSIPNSVLDNENENVFSLYGNYPNPFSSHTTIQFTLVKPEFVTLRIIDMLGNEIATLVNGFKESGLHSVIFTTDTEKGAISSGIYMYILEVGKFSATKQMLLVN